MRHVTSRLKKVKLQNHDVTDMGCCMSPPLLPFRFCLYNFVHQPPLPYTPKFDFVFHFVRSTPNWPGDDKNWAIVKTDKTEVYSEASFVSTDLHSFEHRTLR